MELAVQFARVQILDELLQLARYPGTAGKRPGYKDCCLRLKGLRQVVEVREEIHVSETVDCDERQVLL